MRSSTPPELPRRGARGLALVLVVNVRVFMCLLWKVEVEKQMYRKHPPSLSLSSVLCCSAPRTSENSIVLFPLYFYWDI